MRHLMDLLKTHLKFPCRVRDIFKDRTEKQVIKSTIQIIEFAHKGFCFNYNW